MKIVNVTVSHDIILKPVSDRWYEVQGAFTVDYFTDSGRIHICVDAGFMFDGRSGGPMVEALGIAPNLGTQAELKCWLIHDLNGYDICLSYDETNDLLYDMLRDIGYGWFKSKAIYTAVNFTDSWFGKPLPFEREYPNIAKMHVRHFDK